MNQEMNILSYLINLISILFSCNWVKSKKRKRKEQVVFLLQKEWKVEFEEIQGGKKSTIATN